MSRIDETKDFIPVRIAVLTVSDTRSLAEDRSGDTLVERLTGAGHTLAARDIVTDDRALIAEKLRGWIADPEVDVILSTGGTGLTGRDVTVEAHRDVYEKEIEAFGTVFTIVSMQKIGTSAVQSRACGGVAGGTYLFALPGSPGACRDAWDGLSVSPLQFRRNLSPSRRAQASEMMLTVPRACVFWHFSRRKITSASFDRLAPVYGAFPAGILA